MINANESIQNQHGRMNMRGQPVEELVGDISKVLNIYSDSIRQAFPFPVTIP